MCITHGAESSLLSPSAIYLLLLNFAEVPLAVLTHPRCNPKTQLRNRSVASEVRFPKNVQGKET